MNSVANAKATGADQQRSVDPETKSRGKCSWNSPVQTKGRSRFHLQQAEQLCLLLCHLVAGPTVSKQQAGPLKALCWREAV